MSAVTLEQVLLAGFQTSAEADKRTEQLRSSLGLQARNRVARLAIGRSLSESTYPTGNLDGAGKSIKGDVLFGLDELPLWVGLLFTHLRRADPRAELTLSTLQDLVRRHWNRGIALLFEDWEEAGEDYNKFVDVLVRRRANLPETGGVSPTAPADVPGTQWEGPSRDPVPVIVDLGRTVDLAEPFRWTVNGVGYSPHVAVMGQAGSGKTRTMLEIDRAGAQAKRRAGHPA